MPRLLAGLMVVLALTACSGSPSTSGEPQLPPSALAAAETQIAQVLDAWHGAAAAADEESYFSLLSEDAVFLGTDATERWDKKAFREFAHPFFAKGKAWSFRAVRRSVMVADSGRIAWFDEDLDTPNLGPARGSGVMVQRGGAWRIAHYNLAITIPNDRFDEVKELLASEGATPPEDHDVAVEP